MFPVSLLCCTYTMTFVIFIPLHFKNSFTTYMHSFFFFLRAALRHMEVPRLGVELELLLLAYTTAIAVRDPSHICDLNHSSQQCRILNPLSKTRDRTRILMVTSQVCYCWAKTETPLCAFLISVVFRFTWFWTSCNWNYSDLVIRYLLSKCYVWGTILGALGYTSEWKQRKSRTHS